MSSKDNYYPDGTTGSLGCYLLILPMGQSVIDVHVT